MNKKRKAYYEVERILSNNTHCIIVLMGLRKVGKTTLLRQLEQKFLGHYVDFRKEIDGKNAYASAFNSNSELLLFDEIGHLQSFDAYMETLEMDAGSKNKKIVITSSSYTALRQLVTETLGGGRSKTVTMFPLSFEEYLYFTDMIPEYGAINNPTVQNLEDFLNLKNLPPGMDIIFDRDYWIGSFSDEATVVENMQYASRGIFLEEMHYTAIVDILAYTLNRPFRTKVFGDTAVGVQEYGQRANSIDLSSSLISYANTVAAQMNPVEIAKIIAALYTKGVLFVDIGITMDGKKSRAESLVSDLLAVKMENDLREVLKKYVISVISPLFYTRLGKDIEIIAGEVASNPVLRGRLLELAVKSESIYKYGFKLYPVSYFYRDVASNKEVDLLDDCLFLETTIETKVDKPDKPAYLVDKVLKDKSLVRVITDVPEVWSFDGVFYRIGYPLALLMLSNGSIYNLNKTTVD